MKEYVYKFFLDRSATYIDILSKVLLSLLYVLIGLIIIKVVKYVINKIAKKNSSLTERKIKTLTTVTYSFIKYFIYSMIVCQILSLFGINMGSFIAIAGIGSVAIGFGAQSLVQDVITGLFILMEDQFGVGDVVTIDGKTGTVESIGIRTTTLRSADGDTHIVPNGQIKVVTNMSKGFNRAVVDIGVSYEADIEQVIHIFEDESKNINRVLEGIISMPVVLGIISFSESAIVIRIVADCSVGANWQVERDIRRLMKIRLDKEGIAIPYPKRVIEILKTDDTDSI